MTEEKIIVYTQTGYSACKNAEEYLTERGVDFDDRDITEDEEALRKLTEKYKSRSTPTIVIEDQAIIGFDKEKLDKLFS